MTAISQNHSEFAARLQRINTQSKSSKQLLYVGVDEVYSVKRRELRVKRSRGQVLYRSLIIPVSVALSLAVGAAGLGAGQVARFHLQGLPDLNASPEIEMLIQVGLGLVIALAAGFIIGLTARALMALNAVGVGLGLLFWHNAVHLYPEVFRAVTSAAWVDQIVSTTRFHAMLWRGISVML